MNNLPDEKYPTKPSYATFKGAIVEVAYPLRPCPFCGHSSLTTVGDGQVYCKLCGAVGPKGPRGGYRWNERKP